MYELRVIGVDAAHQDLGELMTIEAWNVLRLDHRDAAEVERPNYRKRFFVAHTSDGIGDKRSVVFERFGVASRKQQVPIVFLAETSR
ncbi:Uncharacterised protein [Mycobacteroides abscessus subsp. massiliense]|nr:Uncharacterised protein [Mycobacteroides abscessus subsp. abscessus]SKQ87345.1 Uncharacterised protein [Mycobacteroides abscessus subsp. massiliense]SLC52010.1 Uncharacterised protein [Mycobacteroides abscessus subsp. massiliense]